MSACVSPPQATSSYIVQTAPNIAQAASTALPPRSKILAPAVAPGGLPVMATQWRPCKSGRSVRYSLKREAANPPAATESIKSPRIVRTTGPSVLSPSTGVNGVRIQSGAPSCIRGGTARRPTTRHVRHVARASGVRVAKRLAARALCERKAERDRRAAAKRRSLVSNSPHKKLVWRGDSVYADKHNRRTLLPATALINQKNHQPP